MTDSKIVRVRNQFFNVISPGFFEIVGIKTGQETALLFGRSL
jgi:hypothetical protein